MIKHLYSVIADYRVNVYQILAQSKWTGFITNSSVNVSPEVKAQQYQHTSTRMLITAGYGCMLGACEFQKFSMSFYFNNDVIKGSCLSPTVYPSAYSSTIQLWVLFLKGFQCEIKAYFCQKHDWITWLPFSASFISLRNICHKVNISSIVCFSGEN